MTGWVDSVMAYVLMAFMVWGALDCCALFGRWTFRRFHPIWQAAAAITLFAAVVWVTTSWARGM